MTILARYFLNERSPEGLTFNSYIDLPLTSFSGWHLPDYESVVLPLDKFPIDGNIGIEPIIIVC